MKTPSEASITVITRINRDIESGQIINLHNIILELGISPQKTQICLMFFLGGVCHLPGTKTGTLGNCTAQLLLVELGDWNAIYFHANASTPIDSIDRLIDKEKNKQLDERIYSITGWWFQPISKILVKMGIFSK